jgi:hypothetical protein
MLTRIVHIHWLLLPALCYFIQPASAQSTVRICGLDLRAGMQKDRVIEAASSSCEVKRLRGGSDDSWCAKPIEKANDRSAPYEGCHILKFVAGVLFSATREGAEAYDDTSANIMNEIYTFVKGAKDNGEAVSVSLGRETEYAGWRFRMIIFSVGDRSLELSITQPVGSPGRKSSIRLTESVELPAPPTPAHPQ